MRGVRDYRLHSADGRAIITGGRVFFVKAESLRLGDFDQHEMQQLLRQHTLEASQIFESGAMQAIWDPTAGQPWQVDRSGR